jgi:hypothetical protein
LMFLEFVVSSLDHLLHVGLTKGEYWSPAMCRSRQPSISCFRRAPTAGSMSWSTSAEKSIAPVLAPLHLPHEERWSYNR